MELVCRLTQQALATNNAAAGVVSNISHCQIALSCAIARGRSRSLERHCLFNIYFFGYGYVYVVKVRVLWLGLGLGLVVGLALIIHTCRANLVLRVIWHCNVFGMTSSL